MQKKKRTVCQKVMNDLIGKKKPKVGLNEPTKLAERAQEQCAETRQQAAELAKPEATGCFPSIALVVVKNLPHPKKISDLAVGDEILCMDPKTKKEIFSKVYMFGHRNEETKTLFLKISCDNGSCVTLSPKHLIYFNRNNIFKVKHADQVEVGDYLVTRNHIDLHQEIQPSKVAKIEEVILDGFYAPFTLCGNMIVDGCLASCYANVHDVTVPLLGKLSAQDIAHLATAPLRAGYLLGSKDILEIREDEEMPACIKKMHKIGKKIHFAF